MSYIALVSGTVFHVPWGFGYDIDDCDHLLVLNPATLLLINSTGNLSYGGPVYGPLDFKDFEGLHLAQDCKPGNDPGDYPGWRFST